MAYWYEVVAAMDKKIKWARVWLLFWSASLGFWLTQLVTDPDWLVYVMTPFNVLFAWSALSDVRRYSRLRKTALLMGRVEQW